MNRYFLEVRYKGTRYAGFQVQRNANTVQAEVEKALRIVLRTDVALTGSSRTDTGVHALQNFFHFDIDRSLDTAIIYNLNALLPPDIAALSLRKVKPESHCRFDAVWRRYGYNVYRYKDPFLQDGAYYFPYAVDVDALQAAARQVEGRHDFTSFSKRNTQVKTFVCDVHSSRWHFSEQVIRYEVRANRFLRGMVRGLAGTMLQVGRGRLSLEQFARMLNNPSASIADFSVPGKGLWLEAVHFGDNVFE